MKSSNIPSATNLESNEQSQDKVPTLNLELKNDFLKKENERLVRENYLLRNKIKNLEKEQQELSLNLELQRQFNPGLNPSGFFRMSIPPSLVKPELPDEVINNELLPWICEQTEKLVGSINKIDVNLNLSLESNPSQKITLKEKIYSKEQKAIAPVLIGTDGQVIELFFTRDSCMQIADKISSHFQLTKKLMRISKDHKNYHIEISKQSLLQLDEYRKKSLEEQSVLKTTGVSEPQDQQTNNLKTKGL